MFYNVYYINYSLVTTGLFGYYAFPIDTNGDILLQITIPNKPILLTFIMLVAYCLLGANVIFSFPLNIFPIRYTLIFLHKNGNVTGKEKIPKLTNVLLTLLLCGCIIIILLASLLIALLYQNISKVFELLGGIPSALISLILPPLAIVKLYNEGATVINKKEVIIAYIMIITGIIIGVGSTILSLVFM